MEPLLTVPEVAERLNCGLSTAYRLIERRILPSVRVGAKKGGVRVTEEDLQRFIESRRTHPQQPEAAKPPAIRQPFTHLDGERLRAAWRRRGVRADPQDGGSAPSSGSTCAPSAPPASSRQADRR